MSYDIKIDAASGDVTITATGSLATAALGIEVTQRILLRLRRQLAEWFLNVRIGLPWYSGILGSKDAPAAEMVIRREIAQTYGVQSILQMNAIWDNAIRTLSLYIQVATIYGTTEQLTLAQGGA
jgi:hypothetical protein